MTVEEFYEWAKARNAEDYKVHILYRDGGGYYSGYDYLDGDDIRVDKKKKIIEL